MFGKYDLGQQGLNRLGVSLRRESRQERRQKIFNWTFGAIAIALSPLALVAFYYLPFVLKALAQP